MQEEADNKPHTISELNQLFLDGESADKDLFSEQRSNILLISGNHYSRKGNDQWSRIRDSKDLPSDQKIRLTKNHIRKIVLTYINSITSYAPGVGAEAKDKASLQHQKAAELANSVWEDGKDRHDFNSKINQWASDFCGTGEVGVKIFQDPSAGKFLGYQAEVDEFGQVVLDEMGQPVPSKVAKFAGDVIIERLFSFNLIRPAGCKDVERMPWWCHRKMSSVKEVKSLIMSSDSLDDQEKDELCQKVVESADQTYVVLDGNSGQYKTVKNETMLKEWFWRPCHRYPKGYFQICVSEAILFEGELPNGIYPIVFKGFDDIPTSPRSRSIVKQLRPNQIEINRTASKMAEIQISSDDKVLIQNGTKLSPGMAYPGVRSFQYSGVPPVVMEGRTGNQYLEYMNQNISEMYSIAMLEEQTQEKEGNYDVYAHLARSIKDKKKFSLYTDKFESFLKGVFSTYIALRQFYSTPQDLIPAIGKSEYINVDEFKGITDLSYVIKATAQTEDAESKLGNQLMLNNIIQYAGAQLTRDDLGKIIKLMPYANNEQITEDLTMDYDFATNCILQLDRGKTPSSRPPNPAYLLKKLENRKMKPDFEFLDPQIQQLYEQSIKMVRDIKTQDEIAIKQAQSEFIPTGGYLVACDFYVPDKANPEKLPKRVRLPSEAMDWLMKQLESQGSDQATLQGLNSNAQSELATNFLQQMRMAGGGGGMRNAEPMSQAPNGPTSPGRMNGY